MSAVFAMPRCPSPSPSLTLPSGSRRSYSPTASPAPFLSPQLMDERDQPRPLPRRLHSLQPSRPSPYPLAAPPAPSTLSPFSASASVSAPQSPKKPQRPGAPHRSHSFCASGSNTTFALASACSAGYLSPDKRKIVAPPLERTLSSIGSMGNTSPPSQQMQRPFPGARQLSAPILRPHATPTKSRPVLGVIDGVLNGSEACPSPPTPLALPPAPPGSEVSCASPIPTILIHPIVTPPRPSLSALRTSSTSSTSSALSGASRSSSYTIVTPSTPTAVLFGSIEESDTEDESETSDNGNGNGNVKAEVLDLPSVVGAVEELSI